MKVDQEPPPTGCNRLQQFHSIDLTNREQDSKQAPGDVQDGTDLSQNRSPDGGSSLQAVKQSHNAKPPFPMAGILGHITASVFFSLSLLCVKMIPHSGIMQERVKQLLARALLITIYTSMTILYRKSTFSMAKGEIFPLVLRSVFGFIAGLGTYVSFDYISVGESVAIRFSSPIWTSVLSYFILGEKFTWSILISLPASIIGIILIAKPNLILNIHSEQVLREIQLSYNGTHLINSTLNGTHVATDHLATISDQEQELLAESFFNTRLPGILIALGTSMLLAMVYITLKYRKSTPVQTATFHFGLISVLCCLALSSVIGFGRWPDTKLEWGLLFACGTLSWLGQSALQWSTAYENASVLSIIRALDVVLAFLYGVAFLHEQILWTSLAGAAIILCVVAIMMLHNYFRTRAATGNK